MTQKIEKTNIVKKMFTQEGMVFSKEEGWKTLVEHINVHNQNLSNELGFNVSWDDALFSWYENIFTPLHRAAASRSVKKAFPELASGDLYLAVSDHWFYLKEKNEEIFPEQAVADFAYINKNGLFKTISELFKGSLAVKEVGIYKKRAA